MLKFRSARFSRAQRYQTGEHGRKALGSRLRLCRLAKASFFPEKRRYPLALDLLSGPSPQAETLPEAVLGRKFMNLNPQVSLTV